MRKNLFDGYRALEQTTQVVESPPLEIFKTHLDIFLCNLL